MSSFLFLLTGELFGRGPTGPGNSAAQAGITLNVTSTNSTCAYNNGILVVTASGGTAPYTYMSYALQTSNASGIFANLPPGVYDIEVTDATGATASTFGSVGNTYTPPYLTPELIDPTGCSKTDGSIILSGTGGLPPYQYSIDDGQNFQSSNVFPNLGMGMYHIYIKDADGCVSSPWSFLGGSYIDYQFYTIRPNSQVLLNPTCNLQLSAVASGPVCGNNGFIEFYAAEGGTPPYTYSLDGVNFAPNNTNGYSSLAPGAYTVYVRDATGLTISVVVDIPRNCPVTAATTEAFCGQHNGTITVTEANGIAPYTYSIDGIHFQASNSFAGLSAAYYTVIARDVNGATSSAYVQVSSGCPSVTATATDATCGQSTGSILAIGTGGAAPYTFSLNGGPFQSSANFTGLASGNYTLTVMDQDQYTGTAVVTVKDNCPTIIPSIVNASCGNNNGSIAIQVVNGTAPGPYQYSLNGGNFQASDSFPGLSPGPYTIGVETGGVPLSPVTANIINVPGPVIGESVEPASCLDNDGSVTIVEQGGTFPFQYSIDGGNFQNDGIFTALDTGMKSVTVRDANGCLSTQSILIPLADQLSVSAGNNSIICQGQADPLQASSNGSSFSWTPVAGLNDTAVLNPVASPQTTTEYTLTAVMGICSATAGVTVKVNPAPTAAPGPDTTICFGKSVQLQGSGGLTYLWSPATWLNNADMADPTVVRPSGSIAYTLQVTDVNGCQSLNPDTVQVTVTPPAKVFAGDDTSVVTGQPLQLHAVDVNNSGFTEYQWSPAAGLNDASIPDPVVSVTGSITYTVIASTPDGCAGEDSVSVKVFAFADIFVPNAFTPNGDGHNDVLRAILAGIRVMNYFEVFNRGGQRIFLTTNAGIGWDGTLNGRPQSAGVYVWAAMGTDYKGNTIRRSGTVILVR